jgi:PTS system galactitol-specific IIB component
MIAQKVEEVVKSIGGEPKITCILPTSVQTYVERGDIDFVVSTSPIPGTITVPVIKGVAILTGMGEEECIEEIKTVAKDILAKKGN